jgi:hypothetical protein
MSLRFSELDLSFRIRNKRNTDIRELEAIKAPALAYWYARIQPGRRLAAAELYIREVAGSNLNRAT